MKFMNTTAILSMMVVVVDKEMEEVALFLAGLET